MNWKPSPTTPRRFIFAPLLLSAQPLLAATSDSTAISWHPQTIWQALAYMLIFAAAGIAAAIVGYKLFDLCTPGDLNKEIIQNKNVAAAIVAAAVILGVCVIIAVAMLG